ncbi:DNA alkylation repair protein [Robertmurraya korlensis]|uniref:DNA alkylation repair protein n=1 Tax=Robertmurraya korlensis TaxID=519977 RepID=UPI00204049FA|nr:DNA alkylation repair protein [Robertmurraya korlensis]MCM3600527.1 DNA alkylation repair protein [Robertmurraya korlensis]
MAELIKDRYSPSFFNQFIKILKSAYPAFDENQFLTFIYNGEWEQLEFKQRIRHITLALRESLPQPYDTSIEILLTIAPKCKGVEYLFFPDFVEVYGLDHWETSIIALEQFTKYSSSEFAVRPFILKDETEMMIQMQQWAFDEDEHIRRLASEGCRPRLPWAPVLTTLKEDPTPILPILKTLKEDPSLYVRKSVANNLNDISKDHPNLLKQIVREWRGKHPHTDWILKHASRSLLKKGDVEILQLFGYTSAANIGVQNFTLSCDQLSLGETLTFSFDIITESIESQNLRIEYGIDFMKANGKQTRKIFHLSQKTYPSGTTHLTREHVFKNLTTRKHYEGVHGICILVNGEEKVKDEFNLIMK